MNRAPEREVVDWLNVYVVGLGTFHVDQWPRAGVKLPCVVVSLVADNNEKRYLSAYGGAMALQFDIYNKADTPEMRQMLKRALRAMRGTVGTLRGVHAVVTNEISHAIDPAGVWRWTVDATVTWEGN